MSWIYLYISHFHTSFIWIPNNPPISQEYYKYTWIDTDGNVSIHSQPLPHLHVLNLALCDIPNIL